MNSFNHEGALAYHRTSFASGDDPKSAERYIHMNALEAAQKVTLLPARKA
jgi:hypothetical protein